MKVKLSIVITHLLRHAANIIDAMQCIQIFATNAFLVDSVFEYSSLLSLHDAPPSSQRSTTLHIRHRAWLTSSAARLVDQRARPGPLVSSVHSCDSQSAQRAFLALRQASKRPDSPRVRPETRWRSQRELGCNRIGRLVAFHSRHGLLKAA